MLSISQDRFTITDTTGKVDCDFLKDKGSTGGWDKKDSHLEKWALGS
jgi:hypothetical protein